MLQRRGLRGWTWRLVLHATPSDRPPAHGFLYGAEQHDVHQLAVIETLQENGNQERPIFMEFQRERDHASEHVDDQKP